MDGAKVLPPGIELPYVQKAIFSTATVRVNWVAALQCNGKRKRFRRCLQFCGNKNAETG